MKYRLGIDIGGTFADFFLVGGASQLWAKVLVSKGDPARAVLAGLNDLATQLGLSLSQFCDQLEMIVHGTTVTTNAVLTRNGVPTMLLTTEGFRDALQMRRGVKDRQYDNHYTAPEPLIPRYLRLGMPERTTSDGRILKAVANADIAGAIEQAKREGVEAIAICFMHAYANDNNEAAAGQFVSENFPGYVSVSSDLLPRAGFYDRLSTAVFDAYVGPILEKYIDSLIDLFARIGFRGTFLVMMSSGGLATPAETKSTAVATLMSGPAAGPIAGARFGTVHGFDDAVTIDMGGTSFDAALVHSGMPLVVRDMTLDGYVVALPTVDIHSIGAGGGSIAWVDSGGSLRVGPQSVGSNPGPACYDLGGTTPTCTDADLLLGYLNPEYFLGGKMKVDVERARAVMAPLAAALNTNELAVASGVNRIINTNMAAGVRAVTINRGIDPRQVPLIVAGGAGPIHAGPIALELDIPVVIVPALASVFCAVGLLLSELKYDFVRSFFSVLEKADVGRWVAIINEMTQQGRTALRSNGVADERVQVRTTARLRYVGQYREIDVDLEPDEPRRGTKDVQLRFHDLHERLYGHCVPDQPVEIVDLAVTVHALGDRIDLTRPMSGDDGEGIPLVGKRSVYLPDVNAMKDVAIYRGARVSTRDRISGPAIVELPNTSLFVPTQFDLNCDRIGSFVLCRKDAPVELRSRLGFNEH